jgi:hypothetical protein
MYLICEVNMKKLIVVLFIMLTAGLTFGQDTKTYIPKNAPEFLPLVKEEATRLMPDLSTPWYFGGLIEHESCISLKHSRCWQPTSELKTSREQGVGLGQTTRAYNSDGSIRFDSLSDLRKANMAELKDLSWSNIKQRPDLQIRSIILMTKGNYKQLYSIEDPYQRLAMTDVAYNAGLGRVKKNRLQCGLTKGCDPQKWFDNVEDQCTASKKPIYSGRSACDIMNHHAYDVLNVRMNKYKPFMVEKK